MQLLGKIGSQIGQVYQIDTFCICKLILQNIKQGYPSCKLKETLFGHTNKLDDVTDLSL